MLGDISPVGTKVLPLTWWRCSTFWAAAAWRARPGRGHAGYPHRGDTDALSRARTATGWGTPCLKIVVLMVFAPQDEGDELPPVPSWLEAVRAALCEHRRRGARGGVRGDLGRWCCNAWAGGECLISSEGSPSFGGFVCLLSFCLCAYERDSRVSPTPQLPFGLNKICCRTKCGGPIGPRSRQRYAAILSRE